MSQERRLILKMLQENRISLEEAETLLDALSGRVSESAPSEPVQPPPAATPPSGAEQMLRHPEQLLKQMGPGIDQLMGSVSHLLGSVTSQWGPAFEKKLDGWRQNTQNTSANSTQALESLTQHTLPVSGELQKLCLHNPLGSIHVTPSSALDTLSFTLHKQGASAPGLTQEKLDAFSLHSHVAEGVLTLRFEGLEQVQPLTVDIQLSVPGALALALSTDSHSIRCENLSHTAGSCHLKSQSGDLWLAGIALKQLELETISGHISAEQSSEQLKISSRSGDVKLKGSVFQAVLQSQSGYLHMETTVLQALRAETQSGDLDLQLQDSPGRIALQSVSGDIQLSGQLQAETTLDSASGDLEGYIRISAAAAVSLNTNSGDIHVHLHPESQCRLESKSRSGEVECRLELSQSTADEHHLTGALGSGAGSLNIRSNSGDILIV